MKGVRKALAVIVLGGASAAAWFGVGSLVQNVQFARAAQEVETNRQALQNVAELGNVYRGIAKVVEPSVVKIDVKKTIRTAAHGMPDMDMLKRQFPDRDGDGEPDIPDNLKEQFENGDLGQFQAEGEGSGVVMEADGGTGFVLTNNHVAGNAQDITVTLSDGREITNCKVVGADPKSDLAVVKINADRLIPARWGNSDYLEKGDLICAFGSPFGYVGSMTHGIVSALNRDRVGIIGSQFAYENFIQVDAPINPGNSGGPLVNLKGEVVGVNTAIASRNGAFNGIGFAIPSNMARPIYDQLKEKGKVVRGYLGVEIGNVGEARLHEQVAATGYKGDNGVLVTSVMNNTPSAGVLQPGDVVTAINGKKVETVTQLRNTIAISPPNTDVKLTVYRDGKQQDVTVKIGEQPDDLLARAGSNRGGNNRGGNNDNGESASADSLGVRLATPNEQQLNRYGLPDDAQGALVTSVQNGSLASQFGLRAGDLITKIGDKSIASSDDATAVLEKLDVSKGIALNVTNKQGQRFVFVKPPR